MTNVVLTLSRFKPQTGLLRATFEPLQSITAIRLLTYESQFRIYATLDVKLEFLHHHDVDLRQQQ